MCCGGYRVCIGQPSCCSDYKENCDQLQSKAKVHQVGCAPVVVKGVG